MTEFLQIDVDATVEAVGRLRELPEFAGVRVSPLLLVARALLIAVARHPMINSTWDEDAQEIVVKHYVNLGIAAATDRGLVVPNIKGAEGLDLPALAGALADLAATARAGRASPADLSGGTITITNVGVFGVDSGTPIITPPEAAILAFGQIKDAPWVVDGQLAVRKVTTLSLSFDHRIVDGDLGSAVLRDIGAMLHDPPAHAGVGLTYSEGSPMFRHTVLFTFTPQTTLEQQEELARQLRTLPGVIGEIKDYHVGLDAGLNPGNYQFAVVADFDNVEDYLVYRDHPVHREIIGKYVTPIVADRAAVQYELMHLERLFGELHQVQRGASRRSGAPRPAGAARSRRRTARWPPCPGRTPRRGRRPWSRARERDLGLPGEQPADEQVAQGHQQPGAVQPGLVDLGGLLQRGRARTRTWPRPWPRRRRPRRTARRARS